MQIAWDVIFRRNYPAYSDWFASKKNMTPPEKIYVTLEQAGEIFNQQRSHRRIGDIIGLVWVDDFETWLAFNSGLICVDMSKE